MLEKFYKVLQLNIPWGLHLHNVYQNIADHHVVFWVVQVSVYELTELVLIHIPDLFIFLTRSSITQSLLLN